jgi:hypothetical protein
LGGTDVMTLGEHGCNRQTAGASRIRLSSERVVEASAIRRECSAGALLLEDAEQSVVWYWLAGQHFLLLMMS